MNKATSNSKVTVACPSGHRIQGDARLVGRTVTCPKCQVEFVFAPTSPVPPLPDVTVRPVENRQVTDTGVMRILGDMAQLPPAPVRSEVKTRPCSRCGMAIHESLAVCNHCNCYVGVLPAFLKDMSSQQRVDRN